MDIRTTVPTIYGKWMELYGSQWTAVKEALADPKNGFSSSLMETLWPGVDATDVPVFCFQKTQAFAALQFLKFFEPTPFDFLVDYTATDEMDAADPSRRFDLVIQLMSMKTKARIRVKVPLAENESFPSLIPLWPGANWAEREIYDMFGVKFDGHPDLRRILMDQRWEGHPLRKDYPLRGYQVFLTPEPIDPELLK